jgi:hypothetical protein
MAKRKQTIQWLKENRQYNDKRKQEIQRITEKRTYKD